MTAKEIQKLDYEREGVRYTIHVEAAQEDTMWGTWNCHDCGVGGSSAVELRGVDVSLDGHEIVRGVSLSVADGEWVTPG